MTGRDLDDLDEYADEDEGLDDVDAAEALPWPPGWDARNGLPPFYRPTAASESAADAFRRAFDECVAEDRVADAHLVIVRALHGGCSDVDLERAVETAIEAGELLQDADRQRDEIMLAVMDDLTGEYPDRPLTGPEREALDDARRERWRACGMGLAASRLAQDARDERASRSSRLIDY